MSFYLKYELLRLVREDVAKTFLATEKSTRREVYLHLVEGRNVELVDRLKRLRTQSQSPAALQIIDIGEFAGSYYIATEVLEGFEGLSAWVDAALKGSGDDAGSPAPAASARKPAPRAGAGQPPRLVGHLDREPAEREATEREPAERKPAEREPAAEANERTERDRFDDLFGHKAKQSSAPEPAEPAAKEPPADEPGEFTRAFGGGELQEKVDRAARERTATEAAEPAEPAPASAAEREQAPRAEAPPKAEAPEKAEAPQKKEPGEFTRLFGSAPAAGDPPPKTAQEPAPPPEPPKQPPPQPPPPREPPPASAGEDDVGGPGEFTRLFGRAPETPPSTPRPAQRATPRPGAEAPARQPASPAPPAGDDSDGPGEFTQLFGQRPETPPPTPRPKRSPLRAESAPQEPIPPDNRPAHPQQPAPAQAPAPPEPPARGGEFTQMFGEPPAPSTSPGFSGERKSERPPRPRREPTPRPPQAEPSFEPLEVTPRPSAATPAPPQKPAPEEQPTAGEFTRLFGKGSSASARDDEPTRPGLSHDRPAARSDVADHDEFSEMFGSGLVRDAEPEPFDDDQPAAPNPRGKPFQAPGEFTQMFGRFDGEPVESRPEYDPVEDDGSASGLFRNPNRPQKPPETGAGDEGGVGEYTRLVRGGGDVEDEPATTGAAAAPAQESSEEPPAKTNKWVLVALAVAVVIAGLAIGVAAYLYMNRPTATEQPAEAPPAVEQPAGTPPAQ